MSKENLNIERAGKGSYKSTYYNLDKVSKMKERQKKIVEREKAKARLSGDVFEEESREDIIKKLRGRRQ